MTLSPTDLQNELSALREHFLATLPDRLHRIGEFWSWILEFGWEPDSALKARITAHSLAGSAATFGFRRLGEHATLLEAALDDLVVKNRPPRHSEIDRVEAALRTVRETAADAHPDLDIVERLQVASPAGDDGGQGGIREIFLLEDDVAFAELLRAQIAQYGYRITHFETVASLVAALSAAQPAVLVIDLALDDQPMAGAETLRELQTARPDLPPAVVVSARGDITARLAAVRASARGFLTKPVETSQLVDVLDRLTVPSRPDPYRVLIIDDDAVTATLHASVLHAAGMETLVVSKPLEVMDWLADFAPDLMLLDVHMPDCSGPELAAVVRQHPAHRSLPIVYLSAEQRQDRQLAAIAAGGDEFVTKPVTPQRLISAVASRAERMRMLRSISREDQLTGLLNHSAVRERLAIELGRSRRVERPLALALVDIDRFQQLNAEQGLAAGEAVIRALGRLLKRELRRGDTVGRYGGGAFLVILPETGVKAAALKLDQLRRQFAALVFNSGGSAFTVTLSCGLAGYPERLSEGDLTAAADTALRRAKDFGRDRIEVAGRA